MLTKNKLLQLMSQLPQIAENTKFADKSVTICIITPIRLAPDLGFICISASPALRLETPTF